ncbi:hypothetical protein [Corynebacterium lactis]|uniref:Uncharacterized protein n=1 Tax=Corynebacterium lactis RW2-5 TaxID=1408189 RepID=A0A0K2H3F2_9CORY|nr:hypothetical protein [Corynebacterium lactis]ALA68562.1 hypothetical protein CLAC_07390 [Corynebacterium lactis RW2-5]
MSDSPVVVKRYQVRRRFRRTLANALTNFVGERPEFEWQILDGARKVAAFDDWESALAHANGRARTVEVQLPAVDAVFRDPWPSDAVIYNAGDAGEASVFFEEGGLPELAAALLRHHLGGAK